MGIALNTLGFWAVSSIPVYAYGWIQTGDSVATTAYTETGDHPDSDSKTAFTTSGDIQETAAASTATGAQTTSDVKCEGDITFVWDTSDGSTPPYPITSAGVGNPLGVPTTFDRWQIHVEVRLSAQYQSYLIPPWDMNPGTIQLFDPVSQVTDSMESSGHGAFYAGQWDESKTGHADYVLTVDEEQDYSGKPIFYLHVPKCTVWVRSSVTPPGTATVARSFAYAMLQFHQPLDMDNPNYDGGMPFVEGSDDYPPG